MAHLVFQGCFFALFYFWGETISVCQTPYITLCDYNGNEYNTTQTVNDSREITCECQEVIFCSVVELSQECTSVTINLDTIFNSTLLNHLQCNISALESQAGTPSFELLNQTENEITVKILSNADFGKYQIHCAVVEIPDEFNATTKIEWDITGVSPAEILIYSEVELELSITEQGKMNSLPVWCFVSTPDKNTEVLSASWVSDVQINCLGFKPVVPGVFTVSLGLVMTQDIFDKAVSIRVVSKPVVAIKAEYSFDFETIFIYFDGNIELHSTCASVFSKQTQEFFGVGFNCFTRGNVLDVKMGQGFKLISNLAISHENKICQAGPQSRELCLPALPVDLLVVKPKLRDPDLSLHLNSSCGNISAQKYMNLEVFPSKRPEFVTQNETFRFKSTGKTQRKNLLMWRAIRQVQSKLSSRSVVLQMNVTDTLPLLGNLSSLDNILDTENNNLGISARVSVFLQSSPASSTVLAEANVTFCDNFNKLFRYSWLVNGKNVSGDGKLLAVNDLLPGKYVFKCVIMAYDSTEILGQGWAITEILPVNKTVLVVPSEITVGREDDVFLRAITWNSNSVSWTCRTSLDKLCLTADMKLVSAVINLNSPNISIPAGSLLVGIYFWTVENAVGSNTAKVSVKSGKVTALSIEMSSAFVKPSQKVTLHCTVRKVQRGCLAWWSSVRQNGFSYFNFHRKVATNTGESEVENKREVSMEGQILSEDTSILFPSLSENLKYLGSELYMFKLQVFCPHGPQSQKGSLDYIKIPLNARSPPRASPLIVEPLTGKAMITNFLISGSVSDVSPEHAPLIFEWSYIDPCGAEVPVQRGAFFRNFTTYLPPGNLKLIVKVCIEKEICSTAMSPNVTVIQASEFFADNFQKACDEMQYLLASGDTLEAFGLATTIFRSLAFVAEPQVREKVFAVVEEGIINRIKDLAGRTQSDSKARKLSLEFFERAVKVAKYFRKDSDVMIRLADFKSSVLKR